MVDTCPTCRGTWVGPDAIQAVLGLDDIRAGLQAARRTDRAKPRPCPRCDAHMRVVLLRGVEVDICPEAHGLWFDRGEIGATR